MSKDDTAPVTKQDISLLMQEMGKIHKRMGILKEELKDELKEELTHDLTQYIDKKHKETQQECKAYMGKLQRDLLSATQDETQILREKDDDHEVRIIRLEQNVAALQV